MADLFIVSGPSGSGKTSLCAALLKHNPTMQLSISSTTRKARIGEQNGIDYFFLEQKIFDNIRDDNGFLEWAQVHGNSYGTRASDVWQALEAGRDVLLEIDWQGAAQVAARISSACRIFILPPSLQELEMRLCKRAQDENAVIKQRVQAAKEEIVHASEAEFRIINEHFNVALKDLLAICRAHRLRA
ncbi:MAG: guanylate kinase [Mariprofundales bacterium]